VLKAATPRDKLGCPTTWANVGSNRSADGVLSALRAGRVFISRDVDGPQLYLTREPDAIRVRAIDAPRSVLLLISAAGVEHAWTVDSVDWTQRLYLPDAPGYVRAQLMDEHGQMLALSNPV
jgi:hypothetical protein